MEKEQIITHPSYGSVSIHRYSGGEREFLVQLLSMKVV